jgi:hypothetical protein
MMGNESEDTHASVASGTVAVKVDRTEWGTTHPFSAAIPALSPHDLWLPFVLALHGCGSRVHSLAGPIFHVSVGAQQVRCELSCTPPDSGNTSHA